MPVIDRMITTKHDLSPRRKWHWETSRLKRTEPGEAKLAKAFPLTVTETFWFDHFDFWTKWPFWEHSDAVYISRSQCKRCVHQFLAVLKPANSRSLQSLKCGSGRSDSIPWLTLVLTHSLTLPHLLNLSLSLYPCLILIFASKPRLWGVGKWAEQSMWGFEDHLELGDRVFVAQPAGHIKRWGRVR